MLFPQLSDFNAFSSTNSNLSGVGAFLFGNCEVFTWTTAVPAVLPVELVSFNANVNNQQVELEWKTAAEINNEGFEVQWAMNNGQVEVGDWETIGFVNGRGTTNEAQNYQFTHDRPENGQNYYRLKQMDFDGKFEYSDIAVVEFINSQTTAVQIFPNPVSGGNLTIKLDSYDDQKIQIHVYDLTGKMRMQQTSFDAITNLTVNDLAAGIYLVEIAANGQTTRQKVVIE